MSCIIENGYELACASTGGIKRVWVGTWDADADYTISTATASLGVITGATGITNPLYEMEQDIEYSGLSQPIQVNRDNGTVHFETQLTLKFIELDFELRNLVVALSRAPLYAVVESNAGKFYILGVESPGRVSEGESSLGTTFDDLNGVELTIQFKSKNGIYPLDENIIGTDLPLA